MTKICSLREKWISESVLTVLTVKLDRNTRSALCRTQLMWSRNFMLPSVFMWLFSGQIIDSLTSNQTQTLRVVDLSRQTCWCAEQLWGTNPQLEPCELWAESDTWWSPAGLFQQSCSESLSEPRVSTETPRCTSAPVERHETVEKKQQHMNTV